MNSRLGYADFISNSRKCTGRNRFLASIIKNAAGLIIFTSLAGLGQSKVNLIQPYLPMMFILHAALFTLYLGKGSFSEGIGKLSSFIVEIPRYFDIALARITQNMPPLVVNVLICITFLILIKLGVQVFPQAPFVMRFVRAIPFVDSDASVYAFKSFLFQVWYIPALFAFLSTGLNWLFFDNEYEYAE